MATTNVERLERAWAEPGAFVTALATVDHKRIGIRYLVTAHRLLPARRASRR